MQAVVAPPGLHKYVTGPALVEVAQIVAEPALRQIAAELTVTIGVGVTPKVAVQVLWQVLASVIVLV